MKERIDFWALPPRRFPWRRMGMSLGIPRAERGPEVEERGLVAHVRKKVSSGSRENKTSLGHLRLGRLR